MDTTKLIRDLLAEKKRIDLAIAALEGLDNTGARAYSAGKRQPVRASHKPRRRRHMSAAARKRMSKMMKARWAARRKAAKKA